MGALYSPRQKRYLLDMDGHRLPMLDIAWQTTARETTGPRLHRVGAQVRRLPALVERALALYSGNLLVGFGVRDSPKSGG